MRTLAVRLSLLMCVAFGATSLGGCAATHATQPVAHAAPPSTSLWKVTSPQRTLYLAGETLALTPADYPLPPPMAAKFQQSSELILEGDPAPPADPRKTGQFILKLGLLGSGQTLSDLLSDKQMATLNTALVAAKLPLARVQAMRPWLAFLMLRQSWLATLGIDPQQQLGTKFYAQAKQRKLRVTSLESFTDQVKMFASFSDMLMAKWLVLRAKDMVNEPSRLAADKHAWRSGDVAYLTKAQSREFGGYPKLYQLLVSERNQRWVRVLQDRLDANGKPVFVVVGLGHFFGSNNLLDLLRARGYTVTQL